MGDAGSKEGDRVPMIAKRAAKFMDQLGHNRVTLRCDNEPAIEALAREIAQACQGESQTVPERPPVGESQSNGIIERAVGFVARQARTLKASLEHRTGTRIPPDARMLCWLVEFAAYLMNRCDIGSDGKTPQQRLHGRRDNTPILEFGEKILYMRAKPARGGKWEPRFHPGVFVGMLNSSSEAVVVTEQGMAMKTRSANIRRIPESERWDVDRILGIRAVPWSPDGSDNASDIQVGRTYLRRTDFQQWGLSEGCLGCWTHARAVAMQLVQHARRRTKLGGRACIDARRSQADARGRMSVRVVRTSRRSTSWRPCTGMTSPSVVNDRRWNSHQKDIEKIRDQEARDQGRSKPPRRLDES